MIMSWARQAKNREKFKWDVIKSVEELGRIRMEAMDNFSGFLRAGQKRREIHPCLAAGPAFQGRGIRYCLIVPLSVFIHGQSFL